MEKVYPFADYLRKLSKETGSCGVVDFDVREFGVWDVWGSEPYQLCSEQLNEITGGSEYARWTLEYGDVRLTDIPKELMSEQAKDERVAWLEGKLSEKTRKMMNIPDLTELLQGDTQ